MSDKERIDAISRNSFWIGVCLCWAGSGIGIMITLVLALLF